jgi:hypothetical protein
MQRRDINAPDACPPVANHTQAFEVSGAARLLCISCQVGQRPTTPSSKAALLGRNSRPSSKVPG